MRYLKRLVSLATLCSIWRGKNMGSPISGKSENKRDATGGANYVSVMDGVPVTNPKKDAPSKSGNCVDIYLNSSCLCFAGRE
jgi:hypothetical protein